MLKTYFKFAFRTFWKDRFYAILNIIGLATGIAVSIIILLYLQSDLTYDQHHEKHRQIYRLVTNMKTLDGGMEMSAATSAKVLAPMLQESLPEIHSFARFEGTGTMLINVPGEEGGSQVYNEEDLIRTDATVFEVFTYPFLAGNPATALKENNSIVLTEKLAIKYFDEGEALGKTLWLEEEKIPYTVTGVIENLPDNSHLKFDGLLSGLLTGTHINQEGEFNSEAIWNPDVYTYLLLPEGYQPEDFFTKLQPFYDKYIQPFGEQANAELWFYLEPLADIHFYSQQDYDEPQGNIAYIYAFGGIGLAILLLACINYMNMATARSGNRGKEVGIRKVMGSSRKALFFSFLGESLILSFIALIVALGLVEVVFIATPFNNLIQKELSLDLLHNPVLLLGMLGITLFMGILSGLYPALYLPSINTVKSLKGAFRSSASGLVLRKSLVTLQFTISIAIVICTFLMQDQLNFMRNKDLGFNREHLLIVPIQDTLVERQIPVIRNELQANSNIIGTTVSYHLPGVDVNNQVFKVETDSSMANRAFSVLGVGKDYLETMGIRLLAGRNFPERLSGEENGRDFIINETAAKALGWYHPEQKNSKLEDALNKKIIYYGEYQRGDPPGHVIGIVQDFNINSLHNAVEPTILIPMSEANGSYFYFRLRGEKLSETVEYIREKWAAYDPNHPFEYWFLDQKFNEQYKADERQSTLISVLAGMCLMISLLGVLGLSAFTAEQRTKEIGVRKVLGATVFQIVYLLFTDVVYLVLLAALLATPIAYYLINYWLEDFAYKTEVNVLLFLLATAAALLIAFLTTSFHSLKTARKNPVVSLRYE